MIRSATVTVVVASAWLAMSGPGVAKPMGDTPQWTFAASTIHHKHRHVVRHTTGGGLPEPVARLVRSEKTLPCPTYSSGNNPPNKRRC